MAWLVVEESTFRKCFRKAGVLDSNLSVVSTDEDPLLAADESIALQELIDKTMASHNCCFHEEYVQDENDYQYVWILPQNWNKGSFVF